MSGASSSVLVAGLLEGDYDRAKVGMGFGKPAMAGDRSQMSEETGRVGGRELGWVR